MVIFAIQDGGWCAAAKDFKGYRKYGKANNCKNGKGGGWANNVYRIIGAKVPAPKPTGNFYIKNKFGSEYLKILSQFDIWIWRDN